MGDIKRIIALSEAKERGFSIGRDDLQLATLGGGEGELAIAGVWLDGEGKERSVWPSGFNQSSCHKIFLNFTPIQTTLLHKHVQ